jgi:hypothetical protein
MSLCSGHAGLLPRAHLQGPELLVDLLDLLAHVLVAVVHIIGAGALSQPLLLKLQWGRKDVNNTSYSISDQWSLRQDCKVYLTMDIILDMTACVPADGSAPAQAARVCP